VPASTAVGGEPPILVPLLVAERFGNLGKYTMADVLARPFQRGGGYAPWRPSARWTISIVYVSPARRRQRDHPAPDEHRHTVAVALHRGLLAIYIRLGGMLATTWIQIVRPLLLIGDRGYGWSCWPGSLNPIALFGEGVPPSSAGDMLPGPRTESESLNWISLQLALVLGTAGLPHGIPDPVLHRPHDAKTAHVGDGRAIWVIGLVLARRYQCRGRPESGREAITARIPGQPCRLLLANRLGGSVFVAYVSAVFATILAVVSGAVIAASGATSPRLTT